MLMYASFVSAQSQNLDALQNLHQKLGAPDMILDSIGQHSATFVRYYEETDSLYIISPNKKLLCVINLGTSPVSCSESKEPLKTKLCSQ